MNKAMKGVSIGAALLVIVLLTGMGWFSLTRGTR
jgi:hypothetical protein